MEAGTANVGYCDECEHWHICIQMYMECSHVGSVVRHGDGEAWSTRGHFMLDTGQLHFQYVDGLADDVVLQPHHKTKRKHQCPCCYILLHLQNTR